MFLNNCVSKVYKALYKILRLHCLFYAQAQLIDIGITS
ncbi:MAG: hypothetical protein DID92_2727745687 [Candidatus Nitrotoga sp. SPKER]|nr:MAG: hypothetical protein DID92_2727745687 [Candidatus Nitrotoga sp. SPKER]